MILRRQLPVASPISTAGLARASLTLASGADARGAVASGIAGRFGARAVALTDSGTSALVAALRLATGRERTVAYPAYACVDLIAAARLAGVSVLLYDVDPHTLSPDLDSLERVLDAGADAVVVAHLYGFPADVAGVRSVAAPRGVTVIEDAAQHAGAMLHTRPGGSLGDLSVLSFGRGKGLTGGNGGALLAIDSQWNAGVESLATSLVRSRRGGSDLAGALAAWLVGRPSIYSLPAAIPALHLGETVYHDAHEPAPMSAAAAALLEWGMRGSDGATAIRRRNASVLAEAAVSSRVRLPCPVDGGTSGYLRFPVLAPDGVGPAPRLGIVRGYPRPLAEQPELRLLFRPTRDPLTGARELARSLLTLPTHHLVTPADLARLCSWLRTA